MKREKRKEKSEKIQYSYGLLFGVKGAYLSEERRVKSEKSKCQVADYTHEAFDFNYFNYYNYFNSK